LRKRHGGGWVSDSPAGFFQASFDGQCKRRHLEFPVIPLLPGPSYGLPLFMPSLA
jgi:hypothetical protein